jgi:hypothetical protein
MTPRVAWLLLAAAALVGIVALVVALGRDRPGGGSADSSAGAGEESEAEPSKPVTVTLYFPSSGGRLVREQREIDGSADPSRLARHLVQAVLDGPQSDRAFRTLPEGITIGEVRVSADGVAYVDLVSLANPSPPIAGSTGELLTLYSLVNSVVENVPGARSLVVLWNGRQPRTFAGHVDTSRPLLPSPELASS